MSLFKCKMCGGDLEIAEGLTVAECEYCGTKQTVPKGMDENLQSFFNRANTLRIKSEFDKAEKLYEKIIQTDPTQADAYWGLILCKYGIEYVDDPATLRKIPTCHRASYDSIIADDDYKSALENADMSQRALYEEQAKEIDRIQREILALAQREENYDVFICYKETDASGARTQDSVIANDIYYQLTNEGFKVFYAAITLEGKLGSAYEPIIFAALNSAKVMLTIGTKPEYFNAVWVKNEWSRFLKIIKKDRSKLLIPCYRDMDAYELPEEFAHLQAQDMSKIGFINDVVRGIKKVITKDNSQPTTIVKETVVSNSPSTNVTPLLKRAFMFLEDGEFGRADDFCEQVLNQDPENAQAYLGKLMAELKVRSQEQLKDCDDPFDGMSNYQKALRFGDDNMKATLTEYIEHINTRNENARLEETYNRAKSSMYLMHTEKSFMDSAKIFETILNYKDSETLYKRCIENAEEIRKNSILGFAKSKMAFADNISECEKAIELFSSISGWRDADEQILKCQEKIEKLKKQAEEQRIEDERLAEIARIEKEKEFKRVTKVTIITLIIISVTIAILVVYVNVAAPHSKQPKVGDYVFFGTYEQDNNVQNGKEKIEWLVLDVQDGKALVISKYALDCREYNSALTNVFWGNCDLRVWLNNTFLNTAFSEHEKASLNTVTVSSDGNPGYATYPGKVTNDTVFLLSVDEANKYFSSNGAGKCEATDYAVAQGVYIEPSLPYCAWWLRSPGHDNLNAAVVRNVGYVDGFGFNVEYSMCAVRPAMWIDLSKINN